MATQIFIGSSKNDEGVCAAISTRLRKSGYQVRAWIDVFGPDGKFILERFETELAETDFCIFLLSPDIDGQRRPRSGDPAPVARSAANCYANPNVVFEIGASIARLGRDRTIIVPVGAKVDGLSELEGLLTHEILPIDYTTSDIIALCDRIARNIESKQLAARASGMRWLTLMRCRPSLQSKVVNTLLANEQSPRFKNCSVRFEQSGVVWGPPDVFLLFTVPGPKQLEMFLRELRKLLERLVDDVDSRMVFPSSYISAPENPNSGAAVKGNLIFLSCRPNRVEEVFHNIESYFAASNPAHNPKVSMIAAGILTGEDDVFLITQTPTEDDHYAFVQATLQKKIAPAEYLVKNTTSMAITVPLVDD